MALVLVAAAFDQNTQTLTLTFDRAVDAAGLVPAEFTVNDGNFADASYVAAGPVTMLAPATLRIGLSWTGYSTGPGVQLTAGAANGIVASDDGGTWAGATNLALPFG